MARKYQKKFKEGEVRLFPYKREDLLTIQDVEQKIGWEITAYNLPETWKTTQGEGVVVAVLDSGCQLDHPDLKDNLLPGKNFVERGKPPLDENCHGTHCIGIIAACNNDLGIVGVAPKTKIIPVKVLDKKGSGNLQNVADGVRWAADQGVDFITMSLGSPTPTPILESAIKYAASKGIVTWCAAGNAGKTRQIFYPANCKDTLGIGAIDQNFDRANFSCTGDDLDFLAPGVDILSTVPENWYAVLSGTSMANPFVVGLACLLLSHKKKNGGKIPKTAQEYRDLLKQNTISVNDPKYAGQHFFEGFGVINPKHFEEYVKNH